jgi:predicted dehydrogenase
MDRRTFLHTSTAGLALAAASRHAFAVAEDRPQRVGLIGCGWYGKSALFRLLQVSPVEVVSICDVDKMKLAEAAEMIAARQVSKKTPRTYGDYREMLKTEELDIVHVATPDHWHALPTIAAVEAGSDVYVEKPTGVDVVESQAMLAAARKYKRVVQVGTQRRSTPHLIEARDTILREGKLGKIGLVEIYCYYHMRSRANPPDREPPAHLDWDMWTGPAPMRPYTGMPWRAFMEYSNGIVGDMCVHMLDMVRWMLDLGWPARIGSAGGIFVDKQSRANTSDTQTATFEYPDDDLNVVWQHRSWGHTPDPEYPWAATFYGDKGTLKASVHKFDFIPRGKGDKIHRDVTYELEQYPEDKTEERLEKHCAPALRRHWLNFLDAVATRGKPVADIEQAHISSASCILANIAAEVGRTLTWDSEKGQIVGDDEANRLLRRPYRKPWVHPEPV